MADRSSYEAPVDPGQRRLAIVAVAVLAAIITFVMLLMSFSTVNTPMSVDGDKAQFSHNLPGE